MGPVSLGQKPARSNELAVDYRGRIVKLLRQQGYRASCQDEYIVKH